MERRLFLRSLFGAAAVGAVLPSEVWPFRKIFLPAEPQILLPAILNPEVPSAMTWTTANPIGLFAGAEITYLAALSWIGISKQAEELKKSFGEYLNVRPPVIYSPYQKYLDTFGKAGLLSFPEAVGTLEESPRKKTGCDPVLGNGCLKR